MAFPIKKGPLLQQPLHQPLLSGLRQVMLRDEMHLAACDFFPMGFPTIVLCGFNRFAWKHMHQVEKQSSTWF